MILTGAHGRYHLQPEPIARGGQGSVWVAEREDGQHAAIKLSNEGPAAREALQSEVDLLRLLASSGVTGIVEVIDTVLWEGRPGLVMPLYPDHAEAFVKRLKEQHGGRALVPILEFVDRVARSLAEVHGVDVRHDDSLAGCLVHRDIKPENILVDAHGGVRLADFGGSLVVREIGAVGRGVFGSPLWAPFEQILPGMAEPNPTWDTYALSAALFWWITGQRPAFHADPTTLLTVEGRAVWSLLADLGRIPPEDRDALSHAHEQLQHARSGRSESDMVEVRGIGSIQTKDRQRLAMAVSSLADPKVHGALAVKAAISSLGSLLARGLSPVAHPSPPNRYWDAMELAEELGHIAQQLQHGSHTIRPPAEATSIEITGRPVVATRGSSRLVGVAIGVLVFLLLAFPLLYALRSYVPL